MEGEDKYIIIYSPQGQEIIQTNYQEGLQVSHLPKGIYFLSIPEVNYFWKFYKA
jgi:hypothetical protein